MSLEVGKTNKTSKSAKGQHKNALFTPQRSNFVGVMA